MQQLIEELFLEPHDVLTVVLATIGMYWTFVFLVRGFGQRALARMSSTDLATIVALGAVIGRAALGNTPTLGGGLVALVTLFAQQALVGPVRHRLGLPVLLYNRPLLLMAGGQVLEQNLRKAHLLEDDLWPVLRTKGIGHRSEVACVILEPTGDFSVIKRGEKLDFGMFSDVRGLELLPDDLFRS